LPIANFLSIDQYEKFFDVVIFDEASQVTPEDAVSAVLRGKSLIVVGDSEQLPPTNFFAAKHSDDTMDEDGMDVEVQSMESLLDECTGIGFREKLLKYHYRSKKEGLIAFSNQSYYNGSLYTFPDTLVDLPQNIGTSPADQNNNVLDVDVDSTDNAVNVDKNKPILDNYAEIEDLPAVEFQWVPNGRKIKGKNKIEADVIAQAIIRHFKSNAKYGTKFSLGIVALSEAQQDTIESALKKAIGNDSALERLVYSSVEEPLFIKNLENVQGDERDFMFFSVGYAKDDQGKISLNFGPLNRQGGYRRLNVAITRARYHLKLFASFLPGDIPLTRVKARGLRDLVLFMRFARTGELLINQLSTKAQIMQLQAFEIDVKNTIEKLGYEVHESVGTSDYRVDLGVVHPKHSTQYILGIECDGGSYARAQVARDRDRIRHTVMQNLGWTIIHIYALDWFQNRTSNVKKIKREINKALK
ncbi:MAG: AAA domain-containing protein, partial [Promethearchaeota archaeon]